MAQRPEGERESSLEDLLRGVLGETTPQEAPPAAEPEPARKPEPTAAEPAKEAEAPPALALEGSRFTPPRLSLRTVRKVAVSIEGANLRLVSFWGTQLEAWASISLSPRLFQGGFIADAELLGDAITTVLTSRGLTRGELLVSFPGLGTLTRLLTLPRGTRPGEIKAIVPREARRQMALAAGYELAWQVRSAKSARPQVLVLAMPQEQLYNWIDAFSATPLKLHWVELKPLSLLRAVGQGTAIIAHGEDTAFELIFARDYFPQLLRSVFLGDEPLPPAEAGDRLVAEVANSLAFYEQSHREAPLSETTPLFLTGALSYEPGVKESLEAQTGRRVQTLKSPLSLPPDFPLPLFAASLGLALIAVKAK